MRYRRRTDANQKAIMDEFRRLGASVFDTHLVGKDFPDLVIGYMQRTGLVEVKDGEGKKKELTPGQLEFALTWRGDTVYVVRYVSDCAKVLQQLVKYG